MPFKSEAQEAWAHTKEGTEALGGKAAVQEWETETKKQGKKLPAHKRPKQEPKPAPVVRIRHTAKPRG